jgi:hypothetical protein
MLETVLLVLQNAPKLTIEEPPTNIGDS